MPDDVIGTEQLMPFEASDSPADAKGLLSALESEPGFDESFGDDEPAKERAPKARTDAPEEEEPGEEDDDPDAEPEDEPDEDEDGESEQEEEPDAEPVFEVDGEKVTLQELKDGRLRQADYTRKTQAVAEERRKAEATAAEARVARDKYAERLEALTLALAEVAPPKRDWDKLKAENPAAYAAEWADHQRHASKVAEVEAEQRRVYEERLADWERQRETTLTQEVEKLHAALPEWKDKAKADAEKAKIRDYVTGTYGWSAEDLANVTDHRLMLVLRKAMLYDEGQTNGKAKIQAKVKPAGQPLKPGARVPQRAPGRKAVERDRKRAARTGRTDDAARYIEHLLDD